MRRAGITANASPRGRPSGLVLTTPLLTALLTIHPVATVKTIRDQTPSVAILAQGRLSRQPYAAAPDRRTQAHVPWRWRRQGCSPSPSSQPDRLLRAGRHRVRRRLPQVGPAMHEAPWTHRLQHEACLYPDQQHRRMAVRSQTHKPPAGGRRRSRASRGVISEPPARRDRWKKSKTNSGPDPHRRAAEGQGDLDFLSSCTNLCIFD